MNGNTNSFYQGIFFSVRTSTWEITFGTEERGWYVLNEFCAHSDPTDYSPPGSSVHEISQARILEWVAISYSRGSNPGLPHCRQILYHLNHQGSSFLNKENSPQTQWLLHYKDQGIDLCWLWANLDASPNLSWGFKPEQCFRSIYWIHMLFH